MSEDKRKRRERPKLGLAFETDMGQLSADFWNAWRFPDRWSLLSAEGRKEFALLEPANQLRLARFKSVRDVFLSGEVEEGFNLARTAILDGVVSSRTAANGERLFGDLFSREVAYSTLAYVIFRACEASREQSSMKPMPQAVRAAIELRSLTWHDRHRASLTFEDARRILEPSIRAQSEALYGAALQRAEGANQAANQLFDYVLNELEEGASFGDQARRLRLQPYAAATMMTALLPKAMVRDSEVQEPALPPSKWLPATYEDPGVSSKKPDADLPETTDELPARSRALEDDGLDPVFEGLPAQPRWRVVAPRATDALKRLSRDDKARLGYLERLAGCVPVATLPPAAEIYARLEAIGREMPNACPLLRRLREGLDLDYALGAQGEPLRLRPLLLHGAPGVGKTLLAERLAEAFGLHFSAQNLGGMSDNRSLAGTAVGWASSAPSAAVQALAMANGREGAASACLFLDEVDKCARHGNGGDPLATILEWTEESTASRAYDPVLERVDLSGLWVICAANRIDLLPGPLLSRFTVIEVPPPAPGDFDAILGGLKRRLAARRKIRVELLPDLDEEVVRFMRKTFVENPSPRMLAKLLERLLALSAEPPAAERRH